jgi:hypothetical protein
MSKIEAVSLLRSITSSTLPNVRSIQLCFIAYWIDTESVFDTVVSVADDIDIGAFIVDHHNYDVGKVLNDHGNYVSKFYEFCFKDPCISFIQNLRTVQLQWQKYWIEEDICVALGAYLKKTKWWREHLTQINREKRRFKQVKKVMEL